MRTVHFDLNQKKDRRSELQQSLVNLRPGDTFTHDHSQYRTPFSVWIAQQRRRLKMKFKYERVKGSASKYTIFLSKPSASAVAA